MSDDDHNDFIREAFQRHQAARNAEAAQLLGFEQPEPAEAQAYEAERVATIEHGAESAEARVAAARTDEALREAGRTREEFEATLPPPPSFDAGARPLPPPPSPSMGSLIRALGEDARDRAMRRAYDLDRLGDHD